MIAHLHSAQRDRMLHAMHALRTIVRRFLSLFQPETVLCEGMILPAKRFRFGGAHFQDDRAFLHAGWADAKKLMDHCGLSKDSAVLELGCGPGRLPIGILSLIGGIKRYEGIDLSAPAIDWCVRHITKTHPSFHFTHVDIWNPRYNKHGTIPQKDARLPYADGACDIIYLYSVFSHLLAEDVDHNLREFARILRPGGRVLLTAFIEDDVPDVQENPEGYGPFAWHGPLHCVRFSRSFFEDLIRKHGFMIEKVDHGTETDGQSAVYLRRY